MSKANDKQKVRSSKRGGFRPNAGRKRLPIPRKTKLMTLAQDTVAKLEAEAARRACPLGVVVDDLVRNVVCRSETEWFATLAPPGSFKPKKAK